MKKFLWIAAFVCLASCGTAKSTQFSGSQPAELKVISYNVRYSKAKDGDNSWQYRRPATIAMLQEQLAVSEFIKKKCIFRKNQMVNFS